MKLISYLALLLFTTMILGVNAVNRSCETCSDCSAVIQSASYGDNVLLAKNALSNGTTCIVFSGKSGVYLDCQGNAITNNRTQSSARAVNIYSGGENQIKNCRLINFDYGIVSNRSNGNTFEGNTIASAALSAISLLWSNGSVTRDNVLNGSAVGITLKEAYNNTLRENIIRGSSVNAVGINVSSSRQNTFTGNDISAQGTGIRMDSGSENNSLYSNMVCLPVYSTGIYLQNGLNYGDNNTCDNTYRYNDACVTGCRNTCSVSTTTTTTTTTTQAQCPLPGDMPPCGVVSLEEVVNYINDWASGAGDLSSVVSLINAWAVRR